jgi:hypothetical protein
MLEISDIIHIADKLRTNILIVFISAILIKTEGLEQNRRGNDFVNERLMNLICRSIAKELFN